MELGAFSVSLSVQDLEASRRFYEKLGFVTFLGDAAQNWLILKNGDHVVGLFQGIFEKNSSSSIRTAIRSSSTSTCDFRRSGRQLTGPAEVFAGQ